MSDVLTVPVRMMDENVTPLFNAVGHHIIALIMQADLTHNANATMAKVNQILHNGNRTLPDAAVFPDVIRNAHPETKPFHFVDIILKDGGPANPPLPAPPHVISKLAEFSTTLQTATNAQEKVDALSWVLHLVGDIHQPLHCVTHVTAAHPAPDGDRGGNSFKLKGTPNNLHSLWDSSVSFTGPENAALVTSIMTEHPRTALATDLAVTDVEKWARASFALAKTVAYAPLHENPSNPPMPTAAYLKNAEKTGRRQAALAGYRLANRLKQIFP